MKIECISWAETNELAVKQKGMPAVYIANNLSESDADFFIWEKIQTRCKKFMSYDAIMNIIHGGLFFFKTDASRDKFFKVFNEKPIYGSAVYASTYDKNGNCLTENT